MGTTYRFLSAPGNADLVLEWFRSVPEPPVEIPIPKGILLHFAHLGALAEDRHSSPAVSVIVPYTRRGVLTTAGEVHFLSTPIGRFDELAKTNTSFRKWISEYPRVHSLNRPYDDSFAYYLEGSLLNWDSDIFVLPDGMEALQAGSYFVSDDDSDILLDKLCVQLGYRGVTGIEAARPSVEPGADDGVG